MGDSVPIEKNKRDCNVTTPSFRCVRRSCRTFLRFATLSLFFLTLQPLCKYAEKKLQVFVCPNSPRRHATITAKTLSLSLNRCLLDANPVYADISFLSCLRHGCVPKNRHQIKHVFLATSTLRGAQSHPPKGSSTAPSEPLDAYSHRHASKTEVDKNHIVRHRTTAEKRQRKHYTTVNIYV